MAIEVIKTEETETEVTLVLRISKPPTMGGAHAIRIMEPMLLHKAIADCSAATSAIYAESVKVPGVENYLTRYLIARVREIGSSSRAIYNEYLQLRAYDN